MGSVAGWDKEGNLITEKVDALKVELLGQLTEQKHDDGGIDETDD